MLIMVINNNLIGLFGHKYSKFEKKLNIQNVNILDTLNNCSI